MRNKITANLKIELMMVMAGMLLFILCCLNPDSRLVLNQLNRYLDANRQQAMTGLLQTMVSIYLLVVTLISLTTVSMRRALLRSNLDADLIFVTSVGLVEALATCMWGILIPGGALPRGAVFLWLGLVSTVTFLRYALAMIKIFCLSMNMMAKDIDEEDQDRRRLLNAVEKIAIRYTNEHEKTAHKL